MINFVPAFFCLLQIVLQLTVYSSDSPVELKKAGRSQDLIVLMRKCYTNESEAQYRMTTVQGGDSEMEGEKVGYV